MGMVNFKDKTPTEVLNYFEIYLNLLLEIKLNKLLDSIQLTKK